MQASGGSSRGGSAIRFAGFRRRLAIWHIVIPASLPRYEPPPGRFPISDDGLDRERLEFLVFRNEWETKPAAVLAAVVLDTLDALLGRDWVLQILNK